MVSLLAPSIMWQRRMLPRSLPRQFLNLLVENLASQNSHLQDMTFQGRWKPDMVESLGFSTTTYRRLMMNSTSR